MKRKRQSNYRSNKRRKSYRKKGRYRRYKKSAIRNLCNALETKRRYFYSGNVTFKLSPGLTEVKNAFYNPFNWMVQGNTDITFQGNAVYIKSFQLRGKFTPFTTTTTEFAGPSDMYVYLIQARDEINTGSISESWTEGTSTTNSWFVGDTQPTTWYVNSSRCKIIYRKHFKLRCHSQGAFNSTGDSFVRSPEAKTFYCKKRMNRMHYFKEPESGVPSSGLFGKYYNYYWVISYDNPLGYNDMYVRMNSTHLITYKDP